MPTFGSLFSGIGGLDLGLERAGWECRWQVEIDEWCRAVLAKHWPDTPRFSDAKAFPADASGDGQLRSEEQDGDSRREQGRAGSRSLGNDADGLAVDLIAGGFPCQPVSNAGRRLAQSDERWLWPEFARIVRVLRPRYVLVENVPGLLARGMGDVLGELAESGYDAEWDCIPAAAVGAPHLRYRVFIVAYANDGGHAPVLGSPGVSGLRESEAGSEPCSAGDGDVPQPPSEGRGRTRPVFAGAPQGAGTFRFPPRSDWWATEPSVGRVAHGVPRRVDRLRGLGNAVVPQVAEWIGRRLMEAVS